MAGALGLVVGGAVASVQIFDGGPAARATGPRVTSTGFSAWEAKAVAEGTTMPQCSYGAGKLLCAQPGVVFALDPSDGRLLWRHPVATSRRSEPPVLSGGLVQPLTDQSRQLEALDPASGRPRWQRPMPVHSAMQSAGGMLLFTAADGTVTGVDGASGDTKWRRRVPGQSMPSFSSFAGDPWAYATTASDDGSSTVTAVDPDTGAVRWQARLRGALRPVGSRRGSVFFLSVGRNSGDTTAVVRYTPESRTSRRVALPVPAQDARGTVRGSVVYILTAGGSLEAVDMDTQKQLWRLETSMSRGSAPVADARHVYVTAADGRLLAVDARSGRLLGQTPPRLGTNSDQVPAALTEPVIAGGRAYAAAPDGTVFGMDGRDPSHW